MKTNTIVFGASKEKQPEAGGYLFWFLGVFAHNKANSSDPIPRCLFCALIAQKQTPLHRSADLRR